MTRAIVNSCGPLSLSGGRPAAPGSVVEIDEADEADHLDTGALLLVEGDAAPDPDPPAPEPQSKPEPNARPNRKPRTTKTKD